MLNAFEVRDDIAVAEHDALRDAGRAAGKDHRSGRVKPDARRHEPGAQNKAREKGDGERGRELRAGRETACRLFNRDHPRRARNTRFFKKLFAGEKGLDFATFDGDGERLGPARVVQIDGHRSGEAHADIQERRGDRGR